MFCASIIRATSLYVLAAVNSALPLKDHTSGAAPPSSMSDTPTEASLASTSAWIAAVSVNGFRETMTFRVWTTRLVALLDAAGIDGLRRLRLMVRSGIVVVAC